MSYTLPIEQLKELVVLAQEPSSDNRRVLLRRITDVFVANPALYTERQNTYFGQIMAQLAFELEREVRRELADRLATESCAPHELICRLAGDEIIVAEPVLESSPVLTQSDLIDISRTRGQQHLRVIAGRGDVGPELSEVLVERGDDAVVEGLLRNLAASISSKAMHQAAERAKTSERLRPALIDRRDVPPQVYAGLLDFLSEKLQSALVGKMTQEQRGTLEDVVAGLKSRLSGQDVGRVGLYIDELERNGALDQTALIGFALQKKPMEFMVGIARMAKLEIAAAQQLMADPTGKALAIVCRSLDFDGNGFRALCLSPVTAIPKDQETAQALLRAYLRLKIGTAQRVLRFWHMRQSIDVGPDVGEMLKAS